VRGALAGVLAFANFRFAAMPGQPYGASYPYWSLSLEEQFYLLLPLLMWGAGRSLPLVVAGLILIQFPLHHNRLYFFLRTDGLLWGVLLATTPMLLLRAKSAAQSICRAPGSGWVLLACILGIMTQLSPPFERAPPYMLGALAACAALPVALAGADMNIFHAGKLQPILLWLGSRSYALYLCHVPIYQSAAALSHWLPVWDPLFLGHMDARSTAIGVAALAAAAEATKRVLEDPLRHYGSRLALRIGPKTTYMEPIANIV
jgi:peptidoglycan/LPS O-acetylase OafA/YrhL